MRRDERQARWIAVAVVVAVPLVALVAGSLPGLGARVASPHGKFKGECGDCHSADAWKPARLGKNFDHAKFGFPLTGAHAATACRDCHASLDFSKPEMRCASCHEDPHRGELGLDCERCHSARSFLDPAGMRRMHQLSAFPLTGSHAGLDCEQCHPPAAQGQMQWINTRPDCDACHADDYAAAQEPDHAASGFSRECATCHGPTAWVPARFDHGVTSFPLTGAHRRIPCASCHGDGVYRGKDSACVSCHRIEYDATADPPHGPMGFPTDCASCHSTETWDGGRFEHDGSYFPIYSGRHAGLWPACSTCHNQPTNYAAYTCFNCHPHSDRAKTDGDHQGESGYAYDSVACVQCHPRGT